MGRCCVCEVWRSWEGWRLLAPSLEILAADPPSARPLTVEAFAERLGTDWIRAAGVLALIGKHVAAGEADCLPQLEAELTAALSLQS